MLMLYLFLLGRLLVGAYFIMSGLNHFKYLEMFTGYAQSKGVKMAKPMVILSGLMMVLGGLGILLGVKVVCSILLLSLFLFTAAFKMHRFWEVSDHGARIGEEINFKKNLALMGALLMLLAIPTPWVMSLFW